MAKDAPNLCSEWVSMMFFSLIFHLKILAHRLNKGFVISGYFGMGTFECCRAMSSGQRFSKRLLWMGSNDFFSLILALKVPAPKLDKGFAIGKYFGTGTFECWWAMPSGQRCSKLLLWMGSNDCFLFDFGIESTGSQT